MKKLKPYIVILIISLLLELIVFNFSTIISLGNREVDLSDRTIIEAVDNGYTLSISDIDEKLNNLKFDAKLTENSAVDVNISLTDEGNYYDYYLPDAHIYSSVKSSFYTNLHTYGKVKSLTLTFSAANGAFTGPFVVNGVIGNVKRPLCFNIIRFLIVLILISGLYAFRQSGEIINQAICLEKSAKEYKKQTIALVVVMLLVILAGWYFSSSHLLFDEASKPHHQQYKELAHSLKEGQVALPYEPSEGLKEAPNPYDTIYLQANGIEYKADYAYYNEKYYVYFGIVPEILLYLPYYLFTGNDLPNHIAVFFFYAVFVFGVFMSLREIAIRYFKDASYVILIMTSVALSTASTFAYLYFTADLYSVPVMAGLGLTMTGLYCWMVGFRLRKNSRLCILLYALGSLFMAMVAGCRPQMLLFSALFLPIFWDELVAAIKSDEGKKAAIGKCIAFCLPYIVVAVGVMYYNYARFGSVFDFGATYSLTNNDMNLRGTSISRMLLGLGSFLFQLPYINGVFPFLQSVGLEYSYMGRMVIEHFYGGVIATNVITWALFLMLYYRDEIKVRGLRLFIFIALVSSIVIGMVDANAAGVLQRYSADMALGIYIAATIMLLIISVKAPRLGVGFIKAGFILGLGMTLLMICNTASGITLNYYNPELFGTLRSIFIF